MPQPYWKLGKIATVASKVAYPKQLAYFSLAAILAIVAILPFNMVIAPKIIAFSRFQNQSKYKRGNLCKESNHFAEAIVRQIYKKYMIQQTGFIALFPG